MGKYPSTLLVLRKAIYRKSWGFTQVFQLYILGWIPPCSNFNKPQWRWPFNPIGWCSVYSGTAVHSYTVNCLQLKYFPVSSATKLQRPKHQLLGTLPTKQICKSQYEDSEKHWTEAKQIYHHNTTIFCLLCILSFSIWITQVVIYTPILYHLEHLCSLSSISDKSEGSHLSNNTAKAEGFLFNLQHYYPSSI